MATKPSDAEGIVEPCQSCGRETVHHVRVEIRTESNKNENAEFSREPYRVAECAECGAETVKRMNDA
ncbi:MAG: hypothetical protein ABEJ28_05230 [Salinigranum sp.]